jgi:UDPglucose--hexose-1-phosphate uridylyltransferase
MTRDPYVLTDPTTGRPILMAPRRRARPQLAGRDADPALCPLCPGHEDHTPPEVDAVRAAGSAPDTPGWSVRAVPNLYPATTHHEVVVEGAEHEMQPGRLSEQVWHDALAVHRRRVAHIEAQAGVRTAYLFKNVGARAGASLAHNHTQVIGLPMLPPRLELELAQGKGRPCAYCEEAHTAEVEGRVVAIGEHHVALCPRAPKLPYETWLLPRAHDADFVAELHAQDLAATMHRLFRALDGALGDPPFNMFLHRIPGASFHWHYELQPRTGNLAGLELGGDMYINVLPGDEAAALLRAGLR